MSSTVIGPNEGRTIETSFGSVTLKDYIDYGTMSKYREEAYKDVDPNNKDEKGNVVVPAGMQKLVTLNRILVAGMVMKAADTNGGEIRFTDDMIDRMRPADFDNIASACNDMITKSEGEVKK